MLFGWGDGVIEGACPRDDPLSFGGTGVEAGDLKQERHGTISNVVFPTGINRREDLGLPDRFDVYYGMADNRIGVARLDVPDSRAGRSRRPVGSEGVTRPISKI